MKLYKISIDKILIYCTALCLLLDFSNMWRLIEGSPLLENGSIIINIILCALCIIQIAFGVKSRTPKKQVLIFSFINLFFIAYMGMTRIFLLGFIINYLLPFDILFWYSHNLIRKGKIQSFLDAYSNIIFFIAILSLFFWLFGSIMDILPGRTTVYYEWAEDVYKSHTYFGLYFENDIQNLGHYMVRNLGIFAEAPGYSGYLTYGLLIVISRHDDLKGRRKRKNMFMIIVFFLALLSTFSTKGIIACMLMFFLKHMMSQSKGSFLTVLKWVFGIIVIIGCAIGGYYLLEIKMTNSGMMRIDDAMAALKAWKESPLFGVGYLNSTEVIKYFTITRENNGISMGVTALLAYGGLAFLLFYLGAAVIIKNNSFFKNRFSVWITIVATLFYNLLISNCAYTMVYIFIIASAYAASIKYSKMKIKHNMIVSY